MTMPLPIETVQPVYRRSYAKPNRLAYVPARPEDSAAIVAMFGALHAYNASLDPHFALSDGWETLLRDQFIATCHAPDMLWLLVKDGDQPVGLMIAGVHTDSPLFRHRQWVEVQAVYVADSHRRLGIAKYLLNRAYTWAATLNLPRVQLYITASNDRARSVYTEEGFSTSQAIMRKKL
jgi:GNAT superfamily N-acetyltransferase